MTDQRTAPFYSIPPRNITSIEHPAIIQNVDKAIDTLQGNTGISRVLNPSKADTPANLVLRPEDAMSRPLQSISSPSNNILLKVTVPRRTGRTRKRGSTGPFIRPEGSSNDAGDGDTDRTARDFQRSLADNVGKYQIEPVGMVKRTHVFRGMPDFVFSTSGSPFTNRFREQILSFDYDKMKQFDINMDKGALTNVDIIPPPSFSHGDIPFTYLYRQNPTVKQSIDTTGQITTINTSQSVKVLTHLVPFDIPVVPHQPRESCPPVHTLEPVLQETIQVLEALFMARPAWTRRGLRNSLTTQEQRHALRHAIPYVGYIFRSGPWRDAIVKLGHDPRSSPEYRIYQTAMFRLLAREPEVARDGGGSANNDNNAPGASSGGRRHHPFPRAPEVTALDPLSTTMTTKTTSDGTISTTTPVPTSTTHIFTGYPPLPRDGKMWMFCDITDPLLRSLLFPESAPAPAPASAQASEQGPPFLRQTCEPVADGWFQTATLAKAKTIMRTKIQSLAEDREPDDTVFARIVALFPDHVDEANLQEDLVRRFSVDDNVTGGGVGGGEASSKEMQLATDIRAAIRGAVSWRAMVGRAAGGLQDGDQDGGQDGGQGKGSGKQVRWENDESEGEEEERERVEDEAEAEGEEDMDTAEQ